MSLHGHLHDTVHLSVILLDDLVTRFEHVPDVPKRDGLTLSALDAFNPLPQLSISDGF